MATVKDIKGLKFNRLTALEFASLNKDKKALWKCKCDCELGNYVTVLGHSLKTGTAKSCGCLKSPGPLECNEKIKRKLLSNSIRIGECLEWQGYIPENGTHYGMMYSPKTKKYHSVHRLAYEVFVGEIPQGKCILHSCDNNRCIEVKHLRIGTKSDNSFDMVERKRHPHIEKSKGENHFNSKLKKEDILKIKELRKLGKTLVYISKIYDVHPSTIGLICQRKIWKN